MRCECEHVQLKLNSGSLFKTSVFYAEKGVERMKKIFLACLTAVIMISCITGCSDTKNEKNDCCYTDSEKKDCCKDKEETNSNSEEISEDVPDCCEGKQE